MTSKRCRSDSNNIQPRCDAIRPKTISDSNDSKDEQATNVEYESELERRNRPIIENFGIYDKRLEEEEARILVLSPGSGSDKIKCELKKTSFDGSLQYEALSYHWGNQEKLKSILLRGFDFAVTHNLAEALGYLRHPHEERSLWVDAICLNQYDKEEKKVQLKLMHSIYERASSVIAWLGPPNDASNWAFSALNQLQNADGLQWAPMITKTLIHDGSEAPDDDNLFGELMSRPYWSRAWIVQEIMCASLLFIQCGSEVARYEQLEIAFPADTSVSIEVDSADGEMGVITFSGEAEVKIVRRESQILSPKHYLDCFLDRQCRIRHDNIFAFQYLLRENIDQGLPDYRRNIRELVLQTTLEIIESTQSLHIIIIKGRQKPPRAREEEWQRDMPSWCPYLATPYRCCPINMENGPNLLAEKAVFSVVSKRFKIKEFSVVEGKLQIRKLPVVKKRLQVRGFVIGRVSRTISQRIPPEVRASIDWSPADIELELSHYRKCVDLGLEGVPNDLMSKLRSLEATTRTLFVAGRDKCFDILALGESSAADLERPEIDDLRRMFKNRIFRSVCSFELSLTAKKALASSEIAPSGVINRIALIPHTADEGDEICVILGCSTPVVLRKIRKHYVVLGEAYMDTVSMGEFKVPVRLRDFVLGGRSFDRNELSARREKLYA